jgi:uncharacterized protein
MNVEKGKLLDEIRRIAREKRLILPVLTGIVLFLFITLFFVQSEKGKGFISHLKFRFGLHDISSRAETLNSSIEAALDRWGAEKDISRKKHVKGKEVWNYSVREVTLPKDAVLSGIEKDLREAIHKAGGEIDNREQHDEPRFRVLTISAGIESVQTHLLILKKPLSPRVAILIDDLGRDSNIARSILEIDAPISLAILPGLPQSKSIAREASEKKRDVLVHLPMESHDREMMNKYKKVLRTEMPKDVLEKETEELLSLVPYSTGVNNHMGSKFTENREVMEVVLKKLKEKNLFFVDSRTTAQTVAYDLAKELHIKTGFRSVFLDNSRETEDIKAEILRLISLSKKNGSVIGIGHPDKHTISAIREMLPVFRENGVELVPVSELVN